MSNMTLLIIFCLSILIPILLIRQALWVKAQARKSMADDDNVVPEIYKPRYVDIVKVDGGLTFAKMEDVNEDLIEVEKVAAAHDPLKYLKG